MAEHKSKSLWDAKIIRRALFDSIVKLDPRTMMKNPGDVCGRGGQRSDHVATVSGRRVCNARDVSNDLFFRKWTGRKGNRRFQGQQGRKTFDSQAQQQRDRGREEQDAKNQHELSDSRCHHACRVRIRPALQQSASALASEAGDRVRRLESRLAETHIPALQP